MARIEQPLVAGVGVGGGHRSLDDSYRFMRYVTLQQENLYIPNLNTCIYISAALQRSNSNCESHITKTKSNAISLEISPVLYFSISNTPSTGVHQMTMSFSLYISDEHEAEFELMYSTEQCATKRLSLTY